MKKLAHIYIFFVILTLSTQAYGQKDSVENTTRKAPSAVIKFAVSPFMPYIFLNKTALGSQYERAFINNPKFTFTMSVIYYRYYSTTLAGSQPLWSTQEMTFIAKQGIRYYFRRKPLVYRGFFAGLAPFYSHSRHNFSTEIRNIVGLDTTIGYQYSTANWTLEANYSFGYGGSWYKFSYDPSWTDQKGFDERLFFWSEINVGYRF
jgi:hypothetical protein